MIATYDVETLQHNKKTKEWEPILDATGKHFIIGCVKKETGGKKTFTKPEDMWDYIKKEGLKELKRGKKLHLYAHNARYDFYNIADLKDTNLVFFSEPTPFIASYYYPVKRTFTKEKFKHWQWYAQKEHIRYEIISDIKGMDMVEVRYLKEGIKFLDTLSIYKMPLKKIGDIIGEPKTEMPHNITGNLTKKNLKELATYCMQDCNVILKAVHYLKEKLEQEGINIRNLCTINQIAISYVLNELRKNNAEQILYRDNKGELTDMTWKTKYGKEIHSAYRGGYVRAWKTGFIDGATSIDVNSLYPYSAITMKFPDLRTERKIERPLETHKLNDILQEIGISRAIVYNYDNNLGLLPIRTAERSYIPKAKTLMIGTWTHTELQQALQEGYRILDIEWSITWKETNNPLQLIYTKLYQQRINSKNDFDNFFYKSILNSSLGKFGQWRTDQMIIIDSVEKTYDYIKKNYIQIKEIDGTTDIMFANKDLNKGRPKKYYAPIIPTLVTAQARTIMYHHYKKIPPQDLLYTDTDSIIFTGKHLEKFTIGKELGEFKIETDKETGEQLINQRYICWGTKSKSIGNNIAVSGVFKSGLTMEDFAQGKATSKHMRGIKTAQEKEIGTFITEQRNLQQQQKDYHETEQLLNEQKVHIDYDIHDITYFTKELQTFKLKM